ncbi:MAG: heavy-metal-associated domain-containing protein [Candidatus Marinimicrobia bacterium]|nr:heavy-metal-associated domain-containing protein [Candidatus Neomarinimicrobiota bacterium]
MKDTLKFKTNINCNGCKSKVTPILDETKGIIHWDVDLENEDKILTISSKDITNEDVVERLKTVGFHAVPVR